MRFESVPFKNDIKKYIIDVDYPSGHTIFRGQSLSWNRKDGMYYVKTKDIESGEQYDFKFKSL